MKSVPSTHVHPLLPSDGARRSRPDQENPRGLALRRAPVARSWGRHGREDFQPHLMGRLVSPALVVLGQAVLHWFIVQHAGKAIGAGSVCVQVYVDDVVLLDRAASGEGGKAEDSSEGV